MERYFLGVDIGATKSHGLIATGEGRAVSFAHAGAGNHEVVGYDGLAAALQAVTGAALEQAGIAREDLAGAGFGIAGYDWPSERPPTLEAIAPLGLTCPFEVVNDTVIGVRTGAENGWGLGLIAGTSNNCWGCDETGRIGRTLGNGPWFDEFGGSAELVHHVLAQIGKAWTRRGPQTALTDAFVKLLGAPDAATMLEGLSQERIAVGAEAAPVVFEVARQGDPVAIDCIRWVAEELASLVGGVVRQLDLTERDFEVVLIGSMYNGGPLLLEPLQAAIHAVAPGACLVRLPAPPVVGAVLLAMEQVGLDPRPLRRPLIASTQRLLATRSGAASATPPGAARGTIASTDGEGCDD